MITKQINPYNSPVVAEWLKMGVVIKLSDRNCI